MADLKTDYKDDVLDTTQNTKRKYQMIDNGDGTVSFEDVTEYLQQGDSFGADDTNATNTKVNDLETDIDETNTKVNDLETDIDETKTKVNDLETDIDETNTKVNDLETDIDEIDDNLTNLSNRLDNLKFKEVEFNAPSTSGNIDYHSLGTLIGETISFSHVLSVRILNKGNNKWYSVTIISDGYVEYNIQDNSLGIKLSANGVSVYGNSTIRAIIGYYSDN